MSAELLLERLYKVKRTGNRRWMACCPAHEDKHPSLAIRELDDGRVLIHCFALCGATDILDAVGLNYDALYPERPMDHAKPMTRPFPASDVLEALSNECLIVSLAASDVANGKALSEEDRARVAVAAGRIEAGREVANGIR